MDILILSIFIISVVVYYVYANLRSRENRVLIKFQIVQLLIVKKIPVSQDDLLTELNDLRQPDEIKMKHLNKVVYEMIEQSTLLINRDLHVQLHPRISDFSNVNNLKD